MIKLKIEDWEIILKYPGEAELIPDTFIREMEEAKAREIRRSFVASLQRIKEAGAKVCRWPQKLRRKAGSLLEPCKGPVLPTS